MRASAIRMPMGPAMMPASRQATRTGFSPVAPRWAPAFIMAAVAMALVPTANSSKGSPAARTRSTSSAPTRPLWPSITTSFIVFPPLRSAYSGPECLFRENKFAPRGSSGQKTADPTPDRCAPVSGSAGFPGKCPKDGQIVITGQFWVKAVAAFHDIQPPRQDGHRLPGGTGCGSRKDGKRRLRSD